jgi:Fe-S-cluster containining protein
MSARKALFTWSNLFFMVSVPEKELISLREELDLLLAYPVSELAAVISDVGFSCTCCGRCCTKAFNGHVFLLAPEAKRVSSEFLIPAPDFPYSDSSGNFYVEGYALRTLPNGDCVFLSPDRRCTRYEDRFSICRVYPYMLHREPDSRGRVDWRQISGLNLHGEYGSPVSDEECRRIALETISYETAFLEQSIAFHVAVIERFLSSGEKFVRKQHDRRIFAFLRGKVSPVFVWDGEGFVEEVAGLGGIYNYKTSSPS